MMKSLYCFLLALLLLLMAGCEVNDTSMFSEYSESGLTAVRKYGKWGFINTRGQKVIDCQFEMVKGFSDGMAAFQQESLWGYIDSTGVVVIHPQYLTALEFSEGFAFVTFPKDGERFGAVIDRSGKVLFYSDYPVRPYKNGWAKIHKTKQYNYIDQNGNFLLSADFLTLGDFHSGIARGKQILPGPFVRPQHKIVYIDTDGNVIYESDNNFIKDFSEGLLLDKIENQYCYINTDGEVEFCQKNQHLKLYNFSNGLAKIKDKNTSKFGFIDRKGKITIPAIFDYVFDFHEGLAAAYLDSAWGFIDLRGNIVIEPQFLEIIGVGFKNGLCKVIQDSQEGFINRKGEFVWMEQPRPVLVKTDLSKWKLDSLEKRKPTEVYKYGELRWNYNTRKYENVNYQGVIPFSKLPEVMLFIDTTELTVHKEKYYAYKLYLFNGSKDTIMLNLLSANFKIIQQAMNRYGEWRDIEFYPYGFCGNAYYQWFVYPKDVQVFAAPLLKGSFYTNLRFRMEVGERMIYSNSYKGSINEEQLIDPDQQEFYHLLQ